MVVSDSMGYPKNAGWFRKRMIWGYHVRKPPSVFVKIPVDSAEDASHLHGILRAGQPGSHQGPTRRSGLSSNGAKKARTSGQDSVPYVVRCVANGPTGQKSWPSQVTAAVGDQVSQASNHASVLLMRMFLKYCQTTNKTSKSIMAMDDFVFC